MITTVYMKGFWPARSTDPKNATKFWTIQQTIPVLLQTGWQNEKDSVVATAASILHAESGGDPGACLGYINVPGSPSGTKWQKKVWENNRAWLFKQRRDLAHKQIQQMLDTRALSGTLAHRKLILDHCDLGWFQINEEYIGKQYVEDFLNPKFNSEWAYKVIYKGWSNTFNAWVTFGDDGWQKYYPTALEFVKKAREA